MKYIVSPLACIASLALAVGLIGCGAQPGKTIVKYGKDDTGDRMTVSPRTGTAALYGSSSATPEITYPIDQGDALGFRDERSQGGQGGSVIAVADENEHMLQAGTVFDRTYYWKVQEND